MDEQQTETFNQRLNQWIASQGFWFQLRYSMGGGGKTVMFHLFQLAMRVLVLVVILALGGLVFLVKRTNSSGYTERIENRVKETLLATDLSAGGISASRGNLEITKLLAEGGNNTFFSTLTARRLSCKKNLLNGLAGVWNPGVISVSVLDMDLRAGADDTAGAEGFGKAFFWWSEQFPVRTIQIDDATIRWGFSPQTQGSLENAKLTIQRSNQACRITCDGGRFRQNWMKDLKVEELVIDCEPGGAIFEKARFSRDGGTVDFSGLRIEAGERPRIAGEVRVVKLPLHGMIPSAMEDFLEGVLTMDLKVGGSTNTSEGVTYDGDVILAEGNVITVFERLPLLKALSVVDGTRNYKRLDFQSGSFHLTMAGGGMSVSRVDLKADKVCTLKGGMTIRQPTEEEKQNALSTGTVGGGESVFGEATSLEDRMAAGNEEISLARAAEAKKAEEEGNSGVSDALLARIDTAAQLRELADQATRRLSRMLRYQGEFEMAIPPDAFENAPKLQAFYPVDPSRNMIPLSVPISGFLYEVTLDQASRLYEQGQR